MDQLIALGVIVVATFILIPVGELVWDAIRAGGVRRDGELARLGTIVESLATTKEETASGRALDVSGDWRTAVSECLFTETSEEVRNLAALNSETDIGDHLPTD